MQGLTVFRLVPALESLRISSASEFRRDLIAAITVALIAVPQAMAYAMIFGMPVQYGLYTAIISVAVGVCFPHPSNSSKAPRMLWRLPC